MKQFLFLSTVDLDKQVSKLTKIWNSFWPWALQSLKNVAIALLIFIIGRKLIKFLLSFTRRACIKAKLEAGVISFISSVFRILLYVVLFIVLADIIGLPTTSFVALVGSAGLTLGLALQGSLSNFAGGILLLVLKPFRVGDYIIASGNEGTVTAVDIFYTKILTADNRAIVLPNGTLSNSNLINVTNEPVRRLDLSIPASYEADIKKVKKVLTQVCVEHEKVLRDDETHQMRIFVDSFANDAVMINVRVWVETEYYFIVKGELLEEIKYAMERSDLTIPYRQLDVMIKKS